MVGPCFNIYVNIFCVIVRNLESLGYVIEYFVRSELCDNLPGIVHHGDNPFLAAHDSNMWTVAVDFDACFVRYGQRPKYYRREKDNYICN